MPRDFFYPLAETPGKEPLLKQLPEVYQSAAILFYPFIQMPEGWKSDISDNPHHYYPVHEDILHHGKPVTWEEMRQRSGLNRVAEVSIAIHSGITLGLGRGIYTQLDLLDEKIEPNMDEQMYLPQEDKLSPLIISNVLEVLKSNGAKKMKYINWMREHGSYEFKHMTEEQMLDLCKGPIMVMDEYEDFVCSCYFDEASAIFYSKKTNIQPLLASNGLEGVICDEETTILWEQENQTYEII